MDSNKVGAQLVKSISFEVEAIPQDNVVEITNTGKMTPLNIRVRVRKKEDCVVSNGIVSIPRRGKPDNQIETMRLASSDMTIMSFNMLMEADLEKQTAKKQKKKFFGICLGARGEKDDDKYLPSTADDRDDNVNTTSESGMLKLKNMSPLTKPGTFSRRDENGGYRKKDKFFGKCKPGGCLDPPFGEDKYAYQPPDKPRIKALKGPATAILIDSRDVETEKSHDSKTAEAVTAKRKGETSSAAKVPKKENRESGAILSLYQGEQIHSLDENDSDSIITYPPALSSSVLLLRGEAVEKNVARNTSGARQSRKSFNEFSAAYFSPPRTPRDSKDFSGRAERPKSYSTKDIKQDNKPDSISQRRASNANTTVTSYLVDNQTDLENIFNRTGARNEPAKAELAGLMTAAVVGVTGIGIAAARTDESNHSESKKKQDENLLQNTNNILKDDELDCNQSAGGFPAAISEDGITIEMNKTFSKTGPYARSQAKSVDPYYGQSDAMNSLVDDIREIREEDNNRGVTASIGKGAALAGLTRIGITAAMTGESQDRDIIKNIQQQDLPKYISDGVKNGTVDRNLGINQFSGTQQTRHSGDYIVHETHNGTSEIQGHSSHSEFGEDAKTDKFQPHIDVAGNGKNVGLTTRQTNEQGKLIEKKNEVRSAAGEDKGSRSSQGDKSIEEFSQINEEQPKSQSEGIKRLHGHNEGMFEEIKGWESVDAEGKNIQGSETEREYSFEPGQRENEYSSKIKGDQEPYFHKRIDKEITDSQEQINQSYKIEEDNSLKGEQRKNELSSRLGEDLELFPQEGIDRRDRDQRDDTKHEYASTRRQHSNEYYSKLDGEPYSQAQMDQGTINSQDKYIPSDDTETDYSLTRGQRRNDPSKLAEFREPYSQDSLGQVFTTGKTGQQANNLKRGVIETSDEKFQKYNKGPLQKRFEEFQKYEGYDPTSQSDVSAVDVLRANRQDRHSSTSGLTVKPTNQIIDSIFLNLAFQTSNDENQTTVKSLDIAKDNNIDDRNVLLVKSLIKSGRGIVVPISAQHVMNIEIKPAPLTPIDIKSSTPKSIVNFDSEQSEFRGSGISLTGPHAALSIVYNKDLIPLQSVIKDLKEDINILATQQMMLRDRLATRRIKPYNSKKCGCGCSRHSSPKI